MSNLKIKKTVIFLLALFMAVAVYIGCANFSRTVSAAEHKIGELDMTGAPTETLCFAEAIGNDMLYQQNKPVNVWGFAPADSKITVTLSEQNGEEQLQSVEVSANAEGYYIATLEGLPASYTEYKITATDGITTITAEHILFGELFLSAGQSNMALNVKYCSNADEILNNANNPYIRVFMSPEISGSAIYPYYPVAYWEGGVWARGDSNILIQGASAVCYNFALDLFDRLNQNGQEVPVGFLNASKGATSIEAWLSRASIDQENADVYKYLDGKGRLLTEDEYNKSGSQNFNQVSAMFNSKIAPLSNFEIAGILWYQGENNVGNEVAGQYYRKALSLLAKDWSAWFNGGDEEIPFIFAQITPHNYKYEGEALAYMWEGMAEAWADNSDQMGMVTTYDVPLDWYNESFAYRSPIHPIVKKPVGQRMSLLAYNMLYGGTGAKSSPVFDSAKFENGKAVISFKNAKSLKTTNGLDVMGFTLCGENRVFYPAEAVINSDGTVTLTSRWVKEPVAATYGFSEMIMSSNLCSDEGLPVAPFRTDKVQSTYYHPKDWQSCDAMEYFVSYGSGTTEDMTEMAAPFTKSTNVTLSTVEGDYGNAMKLSYSLRGKEEFYISPVLGKDNENGIFEQIVNYDTFFFKVKSNNSRNITVSRVEIALADGRKWDAALALEDGTSMTVKGGSEEYVNCYFSLNPTFAPENATAEELAALRAQISSIKIYFRDIASGTLEVDSFAYGNLADLNVDYDGETGGEGGEVTPPDGGDGGDEGDKPSENGGNGLSGLEIGFIVGGSVIVAACIGAVVFIAVRRKK